MLYGTRFCLLPDLARAEQSSQKWHRICCVRGLHVEETGSASVAELPHFTSSPRGRCVNCEWPEAIAHTNSGAYLASGIVISSSGSVFLPRVLPNWHSKTAIDANKSPITILIMIRRARPLYAPSAPSNGPRRLRDLSENIAESGSSLYTTSLAYFSYAARGMDFGASILAARLPVQSLILDSRVRSAGSLGSAMGWNMTATIEEHMRMTNEVA